MARTIVQYLGTGRRKTSTARVILRPGTGRILVNQVPVETYFARESLRTDLNQPFVLTETGDKFDTLVNVAGGGLTGQAGAIRLGVARALLEVSPQNREVLKRAGMLTRDSREVERKKYGQAGARAHFQFSKR